MISSFYFDKGDFMPMQQDALVVEVAALGRKEAAVIAVCDGIGGLQEGEYASSYVTMRIRNWFYGAYLKHRKKGHGRRRIERDCARMLYDCNRYLQRYGKERGIKLGTTMTMVLLYERKTFGICGTGCSLQYLLFHAGDSRAYRIGKKCEMLTADDSDGGRALYRCIGSFPWRDVQKGRGRLQRGERLLLCSDGFWRTLQEEELAESLGRSGLSGRNGISGKEGLSERSGFPGKTAFFGQNGPTEGKMRRGSEQDTAELQLKKRLRKLGQEGRKRGEKDNQTAVMVWLK